MRILYILCIFAAKCCSCLELTIFPDFFLIFRGFLLRKISFFPICKWNSTKSNNFTDHFWWYRDLKIKWKNIFWPLGVINRCLRHKLKKRFEGPQRTVQSNNKKFLWLCGKKSNFLNSFTFKNEAIITTQSIHALSAYKY